MVHHAGRHGNRHRSCDAMAYYIAHHTMRQTKMINSDLVGFPIYIPGVGVWGLLVME